MLEVREERRPLSSEQALQGELRDDAAERADRHLPREPWPSPYQHERRQRRCYRAQYASEERHAADERVAYGPTRTSEAVHDRAIEGAASRSCDRPRQSEEAADRAERDRSERGLLAPMATTLRGALGAQRLSCGASRRIIHQIRREDVIDHFGGRAHVCERASTMPSDLPEIADADAGQNAQPTPTM